MGMGYFTIFELAIGLYLIVCAITGKGKLYENDRLKIPRERYVKVLRIMAAVTGVVLVTGNGLALLDVIPEVGTVSWIFWVIGFGCILAMAVFSGKSTDKNAMRGSGVTSAGEPQKDPLRAAFVFDDEDEEQPHAEDEP